MAANPTTTTDELPTADELAELKAEDSDDETSDEEPIPSSSSSASPSSSDTSDTDTDSDSDEDSMSESDYGPISFVRRDGSVGKTYIYDSDAENTPEANIARFGKLLNSKSILRDEEERDEENESLEDLYNFPPDPENWREEDLKELWADAPLGVTKEGWDPYCVDEEEVDAMVDEARAGRDPPIAPFYVPYRKPYPVIPDNHYDISTPKAVIEELDRIEEFLRWVSYIFPDGSTYEGTVWDDKAHGKGVFVAVEGLVRYEGQWLQNNMEGHGVVEVEIPHMQPIPGSKLEAKMRAEGQIITRDYMTPEDREWLEKDIEDSLLLADGEYEIPFYENEEWVRQFGEKPEKGRYRYAGQWKQGRVHGCGVYEVNERVTYGRFYFGEHLEDSTGCDVEVSGMHAGIAEMAAAKARMFINKPDGMVREYFGPYTDPQHPYFYEEDDMWMAPGFINQFYEVPDYWKVYVNEVDQEREMWLNSFYKAPLRLPMPSELEHWWANENKTPEFVLINKEPEPDPENPDKLIYREDPLILHTPTGRIINYVEDEEHGIRLFWQPELQEGEEVDPEKVEFLPLGFDEFYGVEPPKENFIERFFKSVEEKCKPFFDGLQKWADEKRKASEERKELLKAELDLVEAELNLKEAIEDFDEELELLQKEEEKKKVDVSVEEEEASKSELEKLEQAPPQAEAEEDEDDDEDSDDDRAIPSSFGSVEDKTSTDSNPNNGKSGKSTFASASLSLATSNLVSLVPRKFENPFSRQRENFSNQTKPWSQFHELPPKVPILGTVSFPRISNRNLKLRCAGQMHLAPHRSSPKYNRRNLSRGKASTESSGHVLGNFNVLSLHNLVMMS